jgi:predicted Rossmann fold nucleotide-binding protein DprA/Smf involved in DNA uptake
MTVTDSSLAALLLTNRIVDVDVKPLSSCEFWTLCRSIDDLSELAGASADSIVALSGLPLDGAARIARLLGAATAFSFERERLEEEGIRLVSALDGAFPSRLRERLGDSCPAFLLVAGPVEFLTVPAVGVVGSRDASDDSLTVAASAAKVAAAAGRAVVSGLARGIDQAAMAAALDAGAPVVGFPSEGLRVVGRNAEIRRRVHAGELCVASPYAPTMRFTAGNAMGRNKLIYAHADITLVVCSGSGSGGTWEGAREAMRRNFGRVSVWMGEGSGPGNPKLVEGGGAAITDLHHLLNIETAPIPPKQPSLFERPTGERQIS